MKPETASMVGAILGTLITAIANVIVAKIQKQSGKVSDSTTDMSPKPKSSPKKQKLWSSVPLFALGAIVGGVFGYLLSILINFPAPATLILAPTLTPLPCSFNSKPSTRHAFPTSNLIGTITSPNHCETGLLASRYSPITVEGNIGQIPNNTFIWLLVFSPDGKYYLQCNNTPATKTNCTVSGEWSMRTYLGDECRPYSLVLISTDNDGTKFLLETIDIWERSGSYTGLRSEELKPYEIKELYSIQVETGICVTQTLTP